MNGKQTKTINKSNTFCSHLFVSTFLLQSLQFGNAWNPFLSGSNSVCNWCCSPMLLFLFKLEYFTEFEFECCCCSSCYILLLLLPAFWEESCCCNIKHKHTLCSSHTHKNSNSKLFVYFEIFFVLLLFRGMHLSRLWLDSVKPNIRQSTCTSQ